MQSALCHRAIVYLSFTHTIVQHVDHMIYDKCSFSLEFDHCFPSPHIPYRQITSTNKNINRNTVLLTKNHRIF